MNDITTNINVLVYFILRQNYYNTIIDAVSNAGKYVNENKLYYYTFLDPNTKQKYRLDAYQIIYSVRHMYLENRVTYNTDTATIHFPQSFVGYYNILKQNAAIYESFNTEYKMAVYYNQLYDKIQYMFKCKNQGLDNIFIFNVPILWFNSIPQNEITKSYSVNSICQLYSNLLPYIS